MLVWLGFFWLFHVKNSRKNRQSPLVCGPLWRVVASCGPCITQRSVWILVLSSSERALLPLWNRSLSCRHMPVITWKNLHTDWFCTFEFRYVPQEFLFATKTTRNWVLYFLLRSRDCASKKDLQRLWICPFKIFDSCFPRQHKGIILFLLRYFGALNNTSRVVGISRALTTVGWCYSTGK